MAKRNSNKPVEAGEQELAPEEQAELEAAVDEASDAAKELAEAAREHYEAKEELRQEYGEVLPLSPEAQLVNELNNEAIQAPYSEEQRAADLAHVANLNKLNEDVLPPVTNKTLFQAEPELAALAERFKHLSEAELQMVASANSWSNEFRLEVQRSRRSNGDEIDIKHTNASPSEVELTIDEGHEV